MIQGNTTRQEDNQEETLLVNLLKRIKPDLVRHREGTETRKVNDLAKMIEHLLPRIRTKLTEEIVEQEIGGEHDKTILEGLLYDGYSHSRAITAIGYVIQRLIIGDKTTEEVDKEIKASAKMLKQHVLKTEDYYENIMRIARRWGKGKPPEICRIPQVKEIIPMILLLLVSMFTGTQALTGYDCSELNLRGMYSLLTTEKCPEANAMNITKQSSAFYHIYQESGLTSAKAKECKITKSWTAWYCDKSYQAYSNIIKPTTQPETWYISPEDCKVAFKTHKIHVGADKNNIAKFASAKPGKIVDTRIMKAGKIVKGGYCEDAGGWEIDGIFQNYVAVVEDYRVELKEYDVYFDNAGILVDRPHCKENKGFCDMGDSMIIYSVPEHQCKLALLKATRLSEIHGSMYTSRKGTNRNAKVVGEGTSIHEIPTTDTPMVLMSESDDEGIKLIRKKSRAKCGEQVWETNYQDLYVSKKLIVASKKKVTPENVKMSTYFNNKMDFLYHKNLMTTESVYRALIANDCKLNREILRTKLALALVDADIAAPLLPLSRGTFVRAMGEVLHTYECQEVSVTLRKTDKCTNELPIKYRGLDAYLSPVTHIIVKDVSSVVVLNCSNLLSPMYETSKGQWISVPNFETKIPPLELDLMKLDQEIQFTNLDDVDSIGLYSKEAIEHARKFMMFPDKKNKILTELAGVIADGSVHGRHYDFLLSSDHFEKATLNTMTKIWGKFLILGQIFSGFIGIYCICIAIKIILAQVLSSYHLYKMFGATWKVLVGLFPFLAKFLIFEHQHNWMKTMNENDDSNTNKKPPPRPGNTYWKSTRGLKFKAIGNPADGRNDKSHNDEELTSYLHAQTQNLRSLRNTTG